jgi:citrate lyase subunit beta/citryl-CoA lyase
MAATARPRRSVLYMPGSNVRALEKAKTLAADGLILDLEDAVAPDAKVEARANVVAAAGSYGKREVLIRVNGLATPWGQADVAAASTSAADGILVPKVESADMVRQVEAIMDANNAPADMKIWCMIETPLGVLHVEEIAKATPRLGGFVMGTSDLAKDMRCLHTSMRLPFMAAFNMCVMAARAYGLAIVDGVYLDLSDDQGFGDSCIQGRELGFDGKTLIHPKTIGAANAAFGPTEKEVAWSKTIIEAHANAEKEGKGVVVVDGKLIENLHVVTAKQLVAEAEAIIALEADLASV